MEKSTSKTVNRKVNCSKGAVLLSKKDTTIGIVNEAVNLKRLLIQIALSTQQY